MAKVFDFLSKLAYLLSPIFYNLVFMSIMAAMLGFILIVLRKVFEKKMTAFQKVILWSLVLLALIFPFRFSSKQAIMPKVKVPISSDFRREYRQAEQELFIYEQEERKKDSPVIEGRVSKLESENLKEKRKEVDALFLKALILDVILPLIWFFGSLFFFVSLIFGKLSLEWKLKKEGRRTEDFSDIVLRAKESLGMKEEVEISLLSFMESPALVGFLKPRIVLPSYARELTKESLYYVILHEFAHFKKGDMWLNLCLLILQSVYWFNPFSWLFFKLVREDMEVLTDEYVLARLCEDSKKAYAFSLVEVLSHTHKIRLLPRLLCMVDGKKNVEKRIKMMGLREKIKKYKWFIGLSLLAVSVFLIAIFFTEKSVDDGRDVLLAIKNLDVEEVVDLELTHYDEKKERELYADLKGEDKKNALSLLKSFEGKKNKDFKGVIQLKTSFYLRTVRGEVFSFAVNTSEPETTIAINMKYSFKADQNFLHEIEKFSELAKNEVPKNFPRDSERFRGIKIFLTKNENGEVGFSLGEGLYRHAKSLSEKEKKQSESLSKAFQEFYEKNREDIFLFRRKLRNKGFTAEDVSEFSAGRYEEGKALGRLSENLEAFLLKEAPEKIDLIFEIYDERVSIIIENEENYLLYENYYDGRIEEGGELKIEPQKSYEGRIIEPSYPKPIESLEGDRRALEDLRLIGELYNKAFSSIKNDENRKLTDGELNQIKMTFKELLPRGKGNEEDLMMNPLCNFFYATYGDTSNINLGDFIWYMGLGEVLKQGNPDDEEEFRELKRLGVPELKGYELGGTITPVQRLKASDVDYVLRTYADLGIKDLKNKSGVVYSEKYDNYYIFTSDFGLGHFIPENGEIKDENLILEDEKKRLTMAYLDGRWIIRSFTSKILNEDKTYKFLGSDIIFAPYLSLDVKNYRFILVLNPLVSYLIHGNFEVMEDYLILRDRNFGSFEFRILDNNTLEFISSTKDIKQLTHKNLDLTNGAKFKSVP